MLYCITLHYITLPHITPHYTTLHHIAPHYIALQAIDRTNASSRTSRDERPSLYAAAVSGGRGRGEGAALLKAGGARSWGVKLRGLLRAEHGLFVWTVRGDDVGMKDRVSCVVASRRRRRRRRAACGRIAPPPRRVRTSLAAKPTAERWDVCATRACRPGREVAAGAMASGSVGFVLYFIKQVRRDSE